MSHVDWLFSRQRFGVTPGLGRVGALLDALGLRRPPFDVILVGGTNGKGSTSATLASILTASGRRTGLFTSPHLTRFSERFVVNGTELPELVVDAALGEVRPLAEQVGATFFEIVTALGVKLFADARVDVAVMEVGLGGRLDATNALDPLASVVTNVGLDHVEVLGSSVEEIAREKRGILRPHRLAVTAVTGRPLALLEEMRADLWALGREATLETRFLGWEGWDVRLRDSSGELAFETPLLGLHGASNAALAALLARRLGVVDTAIVAGARATRWSGRMERLPWRRGHMLLDGAHNADGVRALVSALRRLGVERVPVVFGVARDKDIRELARALQEIASEVIVTRALLSPRSADPEELARLFSVPVKVASTPAEALARLPDVPDGLAVVAGSLYLLGEVRPLVLGESGEARERWQ
ncbi:bifunctional folylpolyglutamate synthase/dihydrofolate synthase [Deinococcus yavapaiensis]|uniref:tetrahydrofolate synthase n=1 Tax=Deinococcus yavapaiensis KR-236 TaxID=694435 RepID=A0A318SC43_9DEIO|nr:folylpolyglutamate synthase/dihydrofolate synthase family protein [Deinococcus yavapaiensis]PYE48671.1 dihydrofolate synthase/folylpolyglutamate synthase [Deinococcus yavapaiensis KR-236]